VTVSSRAASGVYADTGGPIVAERLAELGFAVDAPLVVGDGEPVEQALREAVEASYDVVVTTGGTGISPTDTTAQMTRRVIDREVPGVAEAIRAAGRAKVTTADLSCALAGIAGRTLVVNLPGSAGGVRDGMAVLAGLLPHAVEQLHGADHAGGASQQYGVGHQHPGHRHDIANEHPGQRHDAGDAHSDGPPASAEPTADAPVGVVLRVAVTEEPIVVDEHAELVSRRTAGAVVSFAGVVRDHDGRRAVRELDYVGHPSAADVLADVAAQAAGQPGVQALAVSHRIGTLAIGDVALAAAVSCAHRGEAFAACSWLVDEVKHRLPVWKRQVFADGTEEWVNCP
jgi:molybdenum cofactor synthesis domain-containing protein